MTDTRATIHRLESANAVPSTDSLPSGALSSVDLLARIDERSKAMADTSTVTNTHDALPPPKRGRGPLIALGVATGVILVFGVFGLLATTSSDQDVAATQPVPPDEVEQLVTEFVVAMRAGDAAAAASLFEGGTEESDGFLYWLVALDTSGLEFSDCDYEPGAVTCTTTAGPNHFYERIHGEEAQLTFSAEVANGEFTNVTWRPSNADMAAAAAFRTWAAKTHPDLAEVMFDTTPMGILTKESGITMMSLLDEYLASR